MSARFPREKLSQALLDAFETNAYETVYRVRVELRGFVELQTTGSAGTLRASAKELKEYAKINNLPVNMGTPGSGNLPAYEAFLELDRVEIRRIINRAFCAKVELV